MDGWMDVRSVEEVKNSSADRGRFIRSSPRCRCRLIELDRPINHVNMSSLKTSDLFSVAGKVRFDCSTIVYSVLTLDGQTDGARHWRRSWHRVRGPTSSRAYHRGIS